MNHQWILCVCYVHTPKSFLFKHHCEWKRNPGTHQNVMSPAGPLLVCTAKGVRPRLGGEKVDIGQVWDSFWGAD